LRQALELERSSLALLRSLTGAAADRGREADVLDRLGYVALELGQGDEAVAFYREAADIFRRRQDRGKTASTLNGLGRAYRSLGRARQAIPVYQEALAIHRSGGGPAGEGEGVTLHNLGRARAALGQAEEAFEAYAEALAVWQRLDNREQQGTTLHKMGLLYLKLGDSEKAIDSFERALPILEAAGQRAAAARVLVGLGTAAGSAGRARQGLSFLERALATQRQIGDRPGEAETLGNLCWSLVHLGDPRPARAPCEAALSLFTELGDRGNQGSALTNLGWLEERRGESRQAAARFRQALPLLAEAGDRATEASALLGLATAERRLGDPDAALRTAGEALARIEALRQEPGSAELRGTFFASLQETYGFLIDLLMEMHRRAPGAGYDARAFAASEQARARTLLDLLGETAADRAGVSPALRAREAEIGRRLDAAVERRQWLDESAAPLEQRRAAAAAARTLLAERERILAAAHRTASPGMAQAPLGVREVQSRIVDRDTLLLEYALGKERSFVWAVTPEGLAGFELPGRAAIETAARRAHGLLTAGDRSLARSQTALALAELSHLLLAPVAGHLGRKRLLIVGDGALCYVPFAALPAPGAAEPLLAGHEVVTLPSASSLAALRRAQAGRRPAPAQLAVLADPVFDATDPRLSRNRAGSESPVASGPAPRPRFSRLPFSRREAEAILDLVPPAERLGALDFAANRETATGGTLSRYRFLHFATHGILDTEHPDLSGIALSMVDAEGRPRNGFLLVHEIHRLRLPADLVVLSACATALGREVRGEGLVGLTQGFFHAGARAVIVSLWPVDDLATADLMQELYRQLLWHRQPPAAALREAQLSMLRRPDRAAPAFWAGFVLQGDWRSPPRSPAPR
jgi:CHAT domain-containing protein/Tfp pilus assembly protein PilF